jgi:hypothetical protein
MWLQLLLLQVLEYLWLLNSHHEWVYKHMHGDKDTFLLAFAMAGRLGDFKQVSLAKCADSFYPVPAVAFLVSWSWLAGRLGDFKQVSLPRV